MSDTYATSFEVLNYSGLLFNKGNQRTPFSSMIGGKAKTTNSVEFTTGQEYNSGTIGTQPAISEIASLTAPAATVVTREQKTNVVQIFQESLGVSYAKESNMGTLSGLNVAGQQANPMNELDFQTAAKITKINNDIEYTFINGIFNKAASDSQVNKTRGMNSAITTNVIDMNGKALGLWNVADLLRLIYEGNAPTTGLVLWCDAITMFQINADAQQNGLTIVPNALDVNGISLSKVVTPLGEVYIKLGEHLPSGTCHVYNFDVISPVLCPVPGKGNFFREELAKTGAGSKYQLFGQIGLDHGPEWYHGKFTNLSTSFEAPAYNKKVYVTGGTIETTTPETTEAEANNGET